MNILALQSVINLSIHVSKLFEMETTFMIINVWTYTDTYRFIFIIYISHKCLLTILTRHGFPSKIQASGPISFNGWYTTRGDSFLFAYNLNTTVKYDSGRERKNDKTLYFLIADMHNAWLHVFTWYNAIRHKLAKVIFILYPPPPLLIRRWYRWHTIIIPLYMYMQGSLRIITSITPNYSIFTQNSTLSLVWSTTER